MSKRDLFVVIYCCIWGIIGVIGVTIAHTYGRETTDDYICLHNIIFLLVTSSFVLIKPIRKFVDNKIIAKLP